MSPLVSVIIPVKNRVKMLNRAIESVRAQTFKEYELIIVDDASKEDLRKYIPPGTRFVRSGRPLGPGGARNLGARLAIGKYLAFLDSDDLWTHNSLEERVKLTYEGANAVVGGYLVLSPEGGQKEVKVPSDNLLKHLLLRKFFVHIDTLLVSKDLFWKVGGFPEDINTSEDWVLTLKVLAQGNVRIVHKPVAIFVQHKGERVTRNPAQNLKNIIRAYSHIENTPFLFREIRSIGIEFYTQKWKFIVKYFGFYLCNFCK